jgi:2-succinyl-5-enolpyruvyl-6-hydroxy-3-cyclohexene-1-carboxylate synthase
MENQGDINGRWASALIGGLASAGVAHVVISPGSRSTPLALVSLRHPGLSCRVLLDERVAAFYALGLAKATKMPVALICTSGSAVANWHPAVAEADMGRIPLILLTADRPPELQDCGANQTLAQPGLFGPQLRASHALPPAEPSSAWLASFAARAVSQSLWPLPGPVQINVPFREPLIGAAPLPELPMASVPRVALPRLLPASQQIDDLVGVLSGCRGVIVAGAEVLPAAALARLAAALDWPILADPLSSLRFGPHDRTHILARADTFLRGACPAPERVLRFGVPPVSKATETWLAAAQAVEVVVSADCRWPDPGRRARMVLHADPEVLADTVADRVTLPAPQGWMTAFRVAERTADALIAAAPVAERKVVETLVRHLPDDGLLFVGNSMPIRDVDSFSGTSARRLTLLGNRGASGIDGNLGSFFGAVASGRYADAVALVGDLTFLHDLGGLAAGRGLRATVIVVDNGGGAIFGHLPQAALPEFEAGWLTPQSANLEAAAAVWGHCYRKATVDSLDTVLAQRPVGVTIIHLTIDRDASIAAHRDLAAAARAAKQG